MVPQPRPHAAGGPSARRGAARLARGVARLLRLALGLLGVVGLGAGWFVHYVGLPGPIQRQVERQFQARGWQVTFSRLRLRWYRGLVAEHLHVCRAQTPAQGQLFAEEAEAALDWRALRSGRLKVTQLALTQGRLVLPVPGLGEPQPGAPSPRSGPGSAGSAHDVAGRRGSAPLVCLNDLHGQVRFLSNEVWEVRHVQARCLGASLHLSGQIKDVAGLQHWTWLRPGAELTAAERAPYRAVWQRVRRLQFDRAPQLSVEFVADGSRTNWVSATLRLTTTQVAWATGQASNLTLRLQWRPAAEASASPSVQAWVQAQVCQLGSIQVSGLTGRAECELPGGATWPNQGAIGAEIAALNSPTFQADHLQVQGRLTGPGSNNWPRVSLLEARAGPLRTAWLQARALQLQGRLDHGPNGWLPATGALELEAVALQSTKASAPWARLQAKAALPGAEQWRLGATNLLWPQRLSNLPGHASLWLTNAQLHQWQVDRLELKTDWQPPRLMLEGEAGLYGGTAQGQATLDTGTGEAHFVVRSGFDPRPLCPLMNTNVQQVVSACSWPQPPRCEAEGWLELPALSGRGTGASGQPVRLRSVQGQVESGPATLYGVSVQAARTGFSFTNEVWYVRDLVLVRPEGRLEAAGRADSRTGQFHLRFQSGWDPRAVKPLLNSPKDRALLDDFQLSGPPRVIAEVWGQAGAPESLHWQAEVAASNFWFRGERIQASTATLTYSNRFLSLVRPWLLRPGEEATAEGVGVDLAAQMLYLTNAVGRLNPYALARVIGPHVVAVMQPYQFDSPPQARVWGAVDLTGDQHTDDLHVELRGGPFHWHQFNWTAIQGRLAWVGQTVVVTNVHGDFCGGQMAGHIHVDLGRQPGPVVAFSLAITNVDLQRWMADLGRSTNRLEGSLSGALTVFFADLARSNSWQGHGHLQLTNGLIWDIPIFGIFSPVLNAVVPGLGNSRARHATATFTLANSVLHSHDLQIHATGMRMLYDLRVGFDQSIEGRVEAELLRDLPGLGRVVSRLFWPVTKLFEYRLSGTLDQPKATPVFFVPRILLFPFRPIKTLEELFPPSSKGPTPPER